MSVSRVSKLKGFSNVLAGRDLANVFKEGHVYSVRKIMDTIIIDDLGEHALMPHHEGRTISQIMMSGIYMLTKDEYAKLLEHKEG